MTVGPGSWLRLVAVQATGVSGTFTFPLDCCQLASFWQQHGHLLPEAKTVAATCFQNTDACTRVFVVKVNGLVLPNYDGFGFDSSCLPFSAEVPFQNTHSTK